MVQRARTGPSLVPAITVRAGAGGLTTYGDDGEGALLLNGTYVAASAAGTGSGDSRFAASSPASSPRCSCEV